MRKSLLRLAAALSAALVLAGCGGKAPAPSSSASSAPSSSSTPLPQEPRPEPESQAGAVDVDLTTLSSTMVFAEVSSLVYDPIPYLGQRVRMEGIFSVDHAYTMEGEVDLSQNYFYCIIEDALACCAQGLEFSLAGDYAYPEDYPAEGDTIRVVGTVEFFEVNGFRHLRLGDAVLEPVT